MASITLSVLEGFERGRIFAGLPTPVSIGREIENTIQLNDDRVSRFHAKVQDDGGRVILTDLDSTNGTRVNGHPVQIRVLQQGDLVTIGRCVLRFGELPAAPERAPSLSDEPPTAMLNPHTEPPESKEIEFLAPPPGATVEQERLFPHGAPSLPEGLRPLHRAQVSDVLAYFHSQIGRILDRTCEATTPDGTREARCPWDVWQDLISTHMALTAYLHKLAEPDHPRGGDEIG
ncbi:MAG TPA: FHA domain-containing protein [Planctomycetaceae bacterium]|nr:FHA domain-containing protein [Planctomycetaceae bacterium]